MKRRKEGRKWGRKEGREGGRKGGREGGRETGTEEASAVKELRRGQREQEENPLREETANHKKKWKN